MERREEREWEGKFCYAYDEWVLSVCGILYIETGRQEAVPSRATAEGVVVVDELGGEARQTSSDTQHMYILPTYSTCIYMCQVVQG